MRKVSGFWFSSKVWWRNYTWSPAQWRKRQQSHDKIGGFLIFFRELWFVVYNRAQFLAFLRPCKAELGWLVRCAGKYYFFIIWVKQCHYKSWQCHCEGSVLEAIYIYIYYTVKIFPKIFIACFKVLKFLLHFFNRWSFITVLHFLKL